MSKINNANNIEGFNEKNKFENLTYPFIDIVHNIDVILSFLCAQNRT